ncbi:50S ribosomal protein L3 [Paenibacillus thermotolerans]|uniref:50S ribosomal protein L3 n=1 Tax=Paenibacillus thermotolerans TaxID=3027807 RepID=UPI0023684A96|nr:MULTISPECIES: 50S ribosomal protein L3 [unclassified Paenibacillus]
MTKGILGKKLGMTQVFAEDGIVIPVTVIQAGPCVVLQKKDQENDGYGAIQLGFDEKKEKNTTKPALGHVKKAGTTPKRYIKEFRDVDLSQYEVGQVVSADLFAEGEYVDVTGTSKGRGTLGAIQRWNMSRGPMAHGSKYHRGQGSLAIHRDANRVPKGKKMAGRTGNDTVTLQNLQVVKVDTERNVILVKGSIPGPKNSYVKISSAVKK